MSRLDPLPPDDRNETEWNTVVAFFAASAKSQGNTYTKLAGTRIGPDTSDRAPDSFNGIALTHKYMVGDDGTIYRLRRALAPGSFAEVALGETRDGGLWVIKDQKHDDTTCNESRIAVDTRAAKAAFLSAQSREVLVYRYLGNSLEQYITDNPRLTVDRQFDLAIKTAFAVYNLHSGSAAMSKTQYAHLDIKLPNLTIDAQGNVHLIDFGFAERLQKTLTTVKGSPSYVPQEILLIPGPQHEYLDTFALLPILYIPAVFVRYNVEDSLFEEIRITPGAPNDDRQSIFSDCTVTANKALTTLLDTRRSSDLKIPVSQVLLSLILMKHGLYPQDNPLPAINQVDSFLTCYEQIIATDAANPAAASADLNAAISAVIANRDAIHLVDHLIAQKGPDAEMTIAVTAGDLLLVDHLISLGADFSARIEATATGNSALIESIETMRYVKAVQAAARAYLAECTTQSASDPGFFESVEREYQIAGLISDEKSCLNKDKYREAYWNAFQRQSRYQEILAQLDDPSPLKEKVDRLLIEAHAESRARPPTEPSA